MGHRVTLTKDTELITLRLPNGIEVEIEVLHDQVCVYPLSKAYTLEPNGETQDRMFLKPVVKSETLN